MGVYSDGCYDDFDVRWNGSGFVEHFDEGCGLGGVAVAFPVSANEVFALAFFGRSAGGEGRRACGRGGGFFVYWCGGFGGFGEGGGGDVADGDPYGCCRSCD